MLKKIGHGFMALSFLVATSVPAGAAPAIAGVSGAGAPTGVAHEGLTAGVRFTLPFGPSPARTEEPSLNLALDMYKRNSPTGDPLNMRSHRASLASIGFSDRGFDRLAIANRTAISTTRDPLNGDRLNFAPTPSTLLWGAVIVGATVGIYLLVDDGGNGTQDSGELQ